MLTFLRNRTLTQWILISMAVGTLAGWAFPDEQWEGKVKSVSPDKTEVVVPNRKGEDLTFRRNEKPSEEVWEGTDLAREEQVRLKVKNTGQRKLLEAGDAVTVEYLKFNAKHLKPLSDIFLWMIKSLITPLIFSTLVVGIAGHGDDMKRVGRLALKSIIYFEIVTTLALFIGLAAVNLVRPGDGFRAGGESQTGQAGAAKLPDSQKQAGKEFAGKQTTFEGFLKHVVPESVFAAAAQNEVLQIVFWSILFGVALAQVGGRPREAMLSWLEALAEVMFKFTGLVMKYAPIGVGVAIAGIVAQGGLRVLGNLAVLILTLYGALVVFLLLVLLPAAWIARVPLRKFASAVKEPALIAFSTTSSEAALPKAMLAMEAIGVPKRVVAFVMPTGYTFNLDGTTLYLAVASVFVAQAYDIPMTWPEQLVMMLTLMLTSKGVAGVPRAALVILSGTLASSGLPLEAVAILLGVDQIMDMARTTVNLIGNCLATCVMARWEGEFGTEADGAASPPELDTAAPR